MIMVVTLKSGTQIRVPVESFQAGSRDGSLTRLTWLSVQGGPSLKFISLDDVTALHSEPDETPADDAPRASGVIGA